MTKLYSKGAILTLTGSFILLITILSSCATIRAVPLYHPKIDLEKAPLVISKRVLVKELRDSRILKDTSSNRLVFESTVNKPYYYGKLSRDVTDAIIMDFSNNKVFEEIGRDIDTPDYILTGEILEFKEIEKITTFGGISGLTIGGLVTWLSGVTIFKEDRNVSLKLDIYTPDNVLVGSYKQSAEEFLRFSVYDKNPWLNHQLNGMFSTVVLNLRNDLIKAKL